MRPWIAAVAVAAGAALAVEARANCAAPVGYDVEETAPGQVRICLRSFDERSCPDEGLLRRSVDGGAVVQLTRCGDDACFLDECVPAGTYEYGLAEPFACQEAACSTSYYLEVAVAGAGAGCVRSGAAPAAADGVPWTSGREHVCAYAGPGTGCGTAGSVLGTNLALLLAGIALWRWGARRRRAE